jgi:hypothetical protein
MTPRTVTSPVLLLLTLLLTARAAAQTQTPPRCGADSTYHQLDFWVGHWNVYVGDTLVGTSRITSILDGCAVTEEWRDVDGGEGRSLFYVEPITRTWKQVWVTPAARATGGLKEKHVIATLPGGGVRFQGELRGPLGRTILDRTTLTPLAGGTVRQLIEVSTDGGTTWRTTFDARYRPSP